MKDTELRGLFPTQIIRGALLRTYGVAVGLVSGGAPAWDLLAREARGQVGDDYHRLLLSLDAPIDVYVVDEALDLAGEIAALHRRQAQVAHPRQADVLDEIAGYLAELAQSSGCRAKQVIWVVTTGPAAATGARTISSLDVSALLRRRGQERAQRPSPVGNAALVQAVERARRLADGLAQLGGIPQPRLLESEEIARLLYQLADPVRASRYPLAGTLLDRVRRVVSPIQGGLR